MARYRIAVDIVIPDDAEEASHVSSMDLNDIQRIMVSAAKVQMRAELAKAVKVEPVYRGDGNQIGWHGHFGKACSVCRAWSEDEKDWYVKKADVSAVASAVANS